MDDAERILADQILTDNGIGKYCGTRTGAWDKKKKFYQKESVWELFSGKRGLYRDTFTDHTGYINHEMANRVAQAEIDKILFNRARGGDKIAAAEAADTSDEFFVDASQFKQTDGPLDNLGVIDWVFNHIKIKDVDPATAPCPGAYFLLQRLQSDNDALDDFYKTVWPKTIPSRSVIEDARRKNDDGRSNTDLLNSLEAEMEDDVTSEIPLLCLDLEETPRDQDAGGEHRVSEEATE